MEAAYRWECSRAGVSPHPRLLHNFSTGPRRVEAAPWAFASCTEPPEVLWLGGGRREQDPLVSDVDVVVVCVVLRTLARSLAPPVSVRLDLQGEAVGCEGARTIAAILQVSCGVRSVLLRRTRISDEGAAAFGAAVGASSLAELDLGECGITDVGIRHFVRGLHVHGTALSLIVLLLDGNPMGDAGALELLSLVEGAQRPPALALLSVLPAAPWALSPEVAVALRAVCELGNVELCNGAPEALVPSTFTTGLAVDDDVASSSNALSAIPQDCSSVDQATWQVGRDQEPVAHRSVTSVEDPLEKAPPRTPTLPRPSSSRRTPGTAPRSTAWCPAGAVARGASPPRSVQKEGRSAGQRPATTPEPATRRGRHLAAWMAGTERELRELRQALAASSARLDSQHGSLMAELDKLRGQLDAWVATSAAAGGDGDRLETLEARLEALEGVVGQERSECLQIRQLMEVATTAAASDARRSGAAPATPP